MLYAIYEFWLEALNSGDGWAQEFRFLNIFQYTTFRALCACFFAFVFSLWMGPKVITRLILLKAGQPIRNADEVHKLAELHEKKTGTPTMGGILIVAALVLSVLLFARLDNPFVHTILLVTLSLSGLGFLDDYTKVKSKKSDGVNGKTKLSWQFVTATLAALYLYNHPEASVYVLQGKEISISDLCFPLFKEPLFDLGPFAVVFFIVVIVGASNAVNLTDGLDGLATGCTLSTAFAYAMIAYFVGHVEIGNDYLNIPHHPLAGEVAVLLLGLIGACFGFLWFNAYPASVFMGDTGSLAIGGCLGTTVICVKQELLLVIVGFVFVVEALSVMIQVGSFKLTKKRVFKMAPIHHHFELSGWKETQVIQRFWIISLLCALAGLALLKIV